MTCTTTFGGHARQDIFFEIKCKEGTVKNKIKKAHEKVKNLSSEIFNSVNMERDQFSNFYTGNDL